MKTRSYVISFATREDRAARLVRLLQEEGIRAFALPESDQYAAWHDVFVEAAAVSEAARIWDQKSGDPDNGRLLRERRQTLEIPWAFERLALPIIGTWRNRDQ